MQIRRRTHEMSLIRNVYDPARKRCRTVTLGHLPLEACEIPAELKLTLTPAEASQLERIVASNRVRRQIESRQKAAIGLPDLLRQVADWYRHQSTTRGRSREMAQLAEASRAEWSKVLAAMCAAGVGRTRKRRKAAG